MLPWPRAPRTRGAAATAARPEVPPRLEPVDPRLLLSSQPWVVRHHAAHYLSGVWERTGQTSADMESAANRYPIIAVTPNGDHVIRTGHHRSLAALIEGRPVLARLAWDGEPAGVRDHGGGRFVVTPLLRVEKPPAGATVSAEQPATLAARIASGSDVTVSSLERAGLVLVELGLDADQIADRLDMAMTGRTLTSR